jgi:hypothetical protein
VDQDRNNWPIIVGLTAGIVSVAVAGIVWHTIRANKETDDHKSKLRDAQDLIAQCHQKIKEIETGLESLRHPLTA